MAVALDKEGLVAHSDDVAYYSYQQRLFRLTLMFESLVAIGMRG
jgi:hypothetical protein